MRLDVRPGELAICRLDSDASMPEWARGETVATLRNEDELSVVCEVGAVPDDVRADRGWRLLRLAGTQDLTLTGVLAALLAPLAEAEVPIFAISSYDTDHVLVPGTRLDDAVAALGAAGHEVTGR